MNVFTFNICFGCSLKKRLIERVLPLRITEIFFSMHSLLKVRILYGPQREKTCLRWFGNNKGTDQPAHPRSLISAFVIRFLESIIFRLATSEISNF